jgi:hypothetical protein
MKSASSDTLWALIGGLVLGLIIGASATAFLTTRSVTPPLSAGVVKADQPVADPLGPIAYDAEETEQREAAAFEVAHFEWYQKVTKALFGDQVGTRGSELSNQANQVLIKLQEWGDPIIEHPATYLVSYSIAAAELDFIGQKVADAQKIWDHERSILADSIAAAENERNYWATASQQNANAAIAARRQAALEQEKAAFRQSNSVTPVQQPPTTTNNPSSQSDGYSGTNFTPDVLRQKYATQRQSGNSADTRTAQEKIADFQKRYPAPPPIQSGIEIRNGRATGPDGNFMNITPIGKSILIEPAFGN